MRAGVRYTLLRVLLFLGCLLLGWFLGLRNDPFLLVLVAAVVSMFLSIFVLRGSREQFSLDVAERVDRRVQRRSATTKRRRREEVLSDEEAEEIERDQDAGRG